MPDPLQQPFLNTWQADAPEVVCDLCDKDYTNSEEAGGFKFSWVVVCPDCAPIQMENIKALGLTPSIPAIARDGESFRAFVLRMRGV